MGMLSAGEFAMFCAISFIAGMSFASAIEKKMASSASTNNSDRG